MKRILLPFVALTMISVGAYAKKSHDMSLQRNLKTFNAMVKTLEVALQRHVMAFLGACAERYHSQCHDGQKDPFHTE